MGTGLKNANCIVYVLVNRQDENLDVGRQSQELLDHCRRILARHRVVQDNHLRPRAAHGIQCLRAIVCLSHNADLPAFFENPRQRLANHLMVVGQDYADRSV